jgi:hypothetical protein
MVKREDIQAWYKQLLEHARSLPFIELSYGERFEEGAARAWATEAQAALEAVFPPSHFARQSWTTVLAHPQAQEIGQVLLKLRGIFEGAAALVRDDRLRSLIDAIRVESESELLDQACVLADNNHRAAATVIAGGALETHLRHYLEKHDIQVDGDGSISKYNGAVGQARKVNQSLYSANDGKLVEAWGGYRNEAAHKPGEFNRSKDDIKRMIEGIREFIGRTG